MYACFVDLSKAFERVNLMLLLDKMKRKGFLIMLVDIFKFIFENIKMCVEYKNAFSDQSTVHRGVR